MPNEYQNSGPHGGDITKSPLLKPAEAAKFLALSVEQLKRLRRTGTGPIFVRLTAKAVRYRIGDLMQFIESRARGRE